MIEPWLLVPAAIFFAIGAVIQGAVGFGGNLFATPIILLIEPDLVPEPVLIGAMAQNLLMVIRDREHAGLRPLGHALAGRVVGTLIGIALLANLSRDALDLTFGVVILAAVMASASGWHVERTPTSLVIAGTASGASATALGVGGPPIGLVYQADKGPLLRGSIARFFLVGQAISIAMLAAFGQLDGGEILAGVALMPGTVLGFWASNYLIDWLDAGRTRQAVWIVASAAAVLAIARGIS